MLPLRDYSFPYADNEDNFAPKKNENDCDDQCDNERTSSPAPKTHGRHTTVFARASPIDFSISHRSNESLLENSERRYNPTKMTTYRRRGNLDECDESLVSSTVLKGPPRKRGFYQVIRRGVCHILEEILALIDGRIKNADGDEVECGPIRYVPVSLDTLTKLTKFTKEELKTMYRTFKNECPNGVVYEDTLKKIYSQFFPSGDPSMYAHYVFNAFDNNQEGFICFEDFVIALSSLLRGKFEEKLQWTFKLYDINHDGFITKEEMHDIVKSVHCLTGSYPGASMTDFSHIEHANRVFHKLDKNGDGYVTYTEFVDACKNDESIVNSMKIFDEDDM